MTDRNRFWRVDASPSYSAANGSALLGVYVAYGALSLMNLIQINAVPTTWRVRALQPSGLVAGADQGVLGLDEPERVPQEPRMRFMLGLGNCPGGVCAIFC